MKPQVFDAALKILLATPPPKKKLPKPKHQ